LNNSAPPLVSVIVTTFNRQELLTETLRSIISQTYKELEIIVVDNFSNYDFFEHVGRLGDERIRPYQNQNDGIIAVNRNFGIKKARGTYIAFCDDDDVWIPEKIDLQVRALTDDFIGVGSEITLIDNYSNILSAKNDSLNQVLGFLDIVKFKSVPLSSLLIRNYGLLFNESRNFFAVEDFDFQLNLTSQNNSSILMLGQSLVWYRIDSFNRSSGIQQKKNSANVIAKFEQQLPKKTLMFCRQLINYRLGKIYLRENNWQNAKRHFIKVLLGSWPTSKLYFKSAAGFISSTFKVSWSS